MLVLICLFMIPMCLRGQIFINMEQDGGLYKVPCSVNGVKMKFIFDTGASAVSLSKSMATYMEDNGFLKKSDYLGKSQSQIADGSVVSVDVVNLKDFEIGGLHLKDVVATVKDGQNVPLLMGQSAIEKLGRISIEGNRLIIHNYTLKLSASEQASLRENIRNAYRSGNFALGIDSIEKLRLGAKFVDEDYYYYVATLFAQHEFEKVLEVYSDWKSMGPKSYPFYCERVLTIAGDTFSVINRPTDALKAYQESLSYADNYSIAYIYMMIADCHYELDRKMDMENNLKKGLSAQYSLIDCSIADVLAGKIKDETLGGLYFRYALYEDHFTGDFSQAVTYMKLSAKCGDQRAIDYCFKNGINYNK